jgi:2'-5' RNA ligase
MRAFIAVEMAAAIRARHAAALAGWRERYRKLRWVPAEKLHITLRFLGGTPDEVVEPLRKRVEKAIGGRAPFALRIGAAGCFGSRKRPRVLWYGLDEGGEALGEIARDLEAIARALRFDPEERPWRPHLTVARNPDSAAADGWEEALSDAGLSGLGQTVSEVVLVSSVIRPGGSVYSPVWTVPLAG